MDLRVGKRVLWVGDAAYPLRNVTRVYSVEFKPKRGETFGFFLVGSVIALVVARSEPDALPGCVLAVAALLVWLLKVLWSPSKYALVIDTSGTASALVTLPHRERLRQLVDAIVEAVESPEKQLHVQVESMNFSRNYHHGDKVNIYGGLGHTGVLKK
ncbi:DUF6232 family protein [Streptomyces capillispiralis]|uniref:Uncharacterized protein n=1 Tax=Streptomyces capillispiralis TaxID=68182 RepID=A0A561TI14_9ACTN|nr:DUF6232 family protein [Streptomyces capillispiralis]TWF86722.1 hypothetical protein FHX78_113710 [Streptomyces capillispiralis]GHH90872.1 hypothetical protein GCM10017779_13290 [Streptomyces capillispiralis]